METQREIEAVALENLRIQRDEVERKMKEIESKREEKTRGESVSGIFDGVSLLGEDGRTYPVPANYASKSNLLDGDTLRLYLDTMVYKQIKSVPRKTIFAIYQGENIVESSDGTRHSVLRASVSYFKLEVGYEVICDVSENGGKFAAIKGVTKRV